jgi:hypothetical protein
MGACNCGEEKNELGGVFIENTKTIQLSGQKFDISMPDHIAHNIQVQALVRGYLLRKNFLIPCLSKSVKDIYEYLGKLDIGDVCQNFCNFQGGVYQGDVNENNRPHGLGRFFSSDKVCEGTWVDGKMSGTGRIIYSNGDIYTGNFQDDNKEGYGCMESQSVYKGDWKNNFPHGTGTEVWPNGSEYQGDYCKGLRHGKGSFKWADGSSYKGDFKHNSIEGQGEYTWEGGRSYTGQWKNNEMHGKGIFKWEDGRCYKGEYIKNKKHGYGVLEFKNGKKYEGYWENGLQNGEGTLITNRNKIKGKWKNGKFCS